jgi:hypothetical protein
MSYSPLKINWRVGATCRLHLQSRRISHARNQHNSCRKQSNSLAECKETGKSLKTTLRNHRCESLKSYMYVTCPTTAKRFTEQVGLALILYTCIREALSSNRLGYRLPSPSRHAWVVSRLDHDRFFPNYFQFIIHQSSFHPMLCILYTDSFSKQPARKREGNILYDCVKHIVESYEKKEYLITWWK